MPSVEFRATSVSFRVDGEPATKSRPRVTTRGGKVRTYSPDHVKKAEAGMAAAFLAQVGRIAPSDRCTFGVEATFYVSSGQRRDVDNMLKLILDGLNKIAWADDHQVYEVAGRKVHDPNPRTEVRIYTTGILASRTATCEHCGETFPRPPSHAAKKYCGMDCRRAGLKAKRTRACKQCGTRFVKHGDVSDQQFCSISCAAQSKHVSVTCVRCGVEFTKPRSLNRHGNSYCSTECKSGYWNEQRKSAAKGVCQDCGGATTKKTYKRCRDCLHLAGGRWADRDFATDPDKDTP